MPNSISGLEKIRVDWVLDKAGCWRKNKELYAGAMFWEKWEALGGSAFIPGHFKRSEFRGQRACTLPILRKFRRGIKIYTTPFFFFLANKGISVVKDYNIPYQNRNTTRSSGCFLSGAWPGRLGWKGVESSRKKGLFFLQIHQGSPTQIKEKPLKRKRISHEHLESVTFRKVIRQWHWTSPKAISGVFL